MAILIVDSNNVTRECLRNFLNSRSYKRVIEAKSEDEGVRFLSADPSIRFVLHSSDLHISQLAELLKEVEEHPNASSLVTLRISSQPRETIPVRARSHRIDGICPRPCTPGEFFNALDSAYKRRVLQHGTVVYLTLDSTTPLVSLANKAHPFQRIVRFANPQEAEKFLLTSTNEVGALIVDLRFPHLEESWFPRIRRAYSQHPFVVIGVGTDSGQVLPVRSFCHAFVDEPRTEEKALRLLKLIEKRLLNAWEVELLVLEIKSYMTSHDWRRAKLIAPRLSRKISIESEAYMLLGDLYGHLNKKSKAIEQFEASLLWNPSYPKAYLSLLELYDSKNNEEELKATLGRAITYCPQHKGILKSLASVATRIADPMLSEKVRLSLERLGP